MAELWGLVGQWGPALQSLNEALCLGRKDKHYFWHIVPASSLFMARLLCVRELIMLQKPAMREPLRHNHHHHHPHYTTLPYPPPPSPQSPIPITRPSPTLSLSRSSSLSLVPELSASVTTAAATTPLPPLHCHIKRSDHANCAPIVPSHAAQRRGRKLR